MSSHHSVRRQHDVGDLATLCLEELAPNLHPDPERRELAHTKLLHWLARAWDMGRFTAEDAK